MEFICGFVGATWWSTGPYAIDLSDVHFNANALRAASVRTHNSIVFAFRITTLTMIRNNWSNEWQAYADEETQATSHHRRTRERERGTEFEYKTNFPFIFQLCADVNGQHVEYKKTLLFRMADSK